ncbi:MULTISPECIES: hypothetical protein [unclassified Roseofilum]|uniref:hypothetical protein n=1 Tax=unclassified Roseofilum TaxID=2620099 RepID=UPI001B17ADE9|nr:MULTISPECIES: hypothetical protein [unclassified Roseofilum]MBP0008028.1 hypothetical protein [Roseofilum sp. Belize Diploria]MBP0011853.1 hypothetical protein [Roseofilum sp. SID3]MBP0024435.1 hypothetical protein [Roseofilum sp. SID2]MBP0031667.1 hypothetical protein [Roseofilum sp. Belize BBD 4]MBP0038647.1 hypothetical protein [Roseofilum sp. SID1]
MTIEQSFYQQLRQRGYWDQTERLSACDRQSTLALAWSNPNLTRDPGTMYKLVWLLSSTSRRKRLSAIDLRILDRTATDLATQGQLLPATKSYVKYLWQQVYTQEYAQAPVHE